MQPFPMIERAVKALIETKYAEADGRVIGDLSYVAGDGFRVWIGLVPGGGGSDQVEGEWVVDVDVFAETYTEAMGRSLMLETHLIGARHVTEVMRIDNVYQNEAPSERPWDDEQSFRVGATYTFTARRSG